MGVQFARRQDNKPATLNAKKLDIDFGSGDDFFNSFQPVTNEKK